MSRMLLVGAAAVAAVSLSGVHLPAYAHHAINAQFNSSREVSFEAVLKQLVNRAPHPYWTFVDDKGAEWKFESSAPATLRRAGLRIKDDIVVGDRYTVYFAPSRDGSRIGHLNAIVVKGKRYNFAPDFAAPRQ